MIPPQTPNLKQALHHKLTYPSLFHLHIQQTPFKLLNSQKLMFSQQNNKLLISKTLGKLYPKYFPQDGTFNQNILTSHKLFMNSFQLIQILSSLPIANADMILPELLFQNISLKMFLVLFSGKDIHVIQENFGQEFYPRDYNYYDYQTTWYN